MVALPGAVALCRQPMSQPKDLTRGPGAAPADPLGSPRAYLLSISSDRSPSPGKQFMPALPITEIRQLVFPKDTLLDAILYVDRVDKGWLHRAVIQEIQVTGGDDLSVVVTAERDGAKSWTKVGFKPAQIAATMIRYCKALKIPLPRNARKQLELQGDSLCLKITVNVTVVPLHSRI